MSHAHLSDDRLVSLCLDTDVPPAALRHLQRCDACSVRQAELAGLMAEAGEAGAQDTDAVFTPERLALQRMRILQRVAQDGRPARVIAFPAGSAAGESRRLFRARPAVRWIAVAAAAGLIVGLAVGRWTNGFSSARGVAFAPVHGVSARLEPASRFAPAAMAMSDDQLLGEIELAASGPVGVLRPIHELTPP